MARRDWPETDVKLTGGAWRLDPWSRILRWVPAGDAPPLPDAFDEPYEPPARVGRPVREVIEHGTYAGARMHHRRGEKSCGPCQTAQSTYKHQANLRRHQEGDPRFTCECGSYKTRAAQRCATCAVKYRWSRDRRAA